MQNKYIWLLLLFAYPGVSCTTLARRVDAPAAQRRIVDEKSYELGVGQDSVVGEPLITRKLYLEERQCVGVQPDRAFRLSGGLLDASVDFSGDKDSVFACYGEVEGQRAYAIPGHPFGYVFGVGLDGHFNGVVGGRYYMRSPIKGTNQYSIDPTETRFVEVISRRELPLDGGGYINHELLYSGRTPTELRVLYREYTLEGMARSAFSQALVFPADAKEIRVKTYCIEVVDARADGMQFRVMSDGS